MADLSDVMTVLDHRTLGPLYQEAGREGGSNPLFDMYFGQAPKKNYRGDDIQFVKMSRVKDPAPMNTRGNPARQRQPTGKEKRYLHMLNWFDELPLSLDVLDMLREPESEALQEKGRTEISQQFDDFATSHKVGKWLFVAKSLTSQQIWIDAEGDILESSSGADTTIETGIPDRNIGQITRSDFGIGGGGDVFSTAWDDPAAKIFDHLDEMQEVCEIQNSETLKHVWMHRTVGRKWLRNNTQVKEFYAAGQERLDQALKAPTFELNDWTFHFYGGTYTTQAGGTGFYIPKTMALLTPDVGPWLAAGWGRQLVPQSLDVVGTFQESLNQWTPVFGDFSYVLPDHNPPQLKMYMGSNMLFGLKNPASVFPVTVDF